jgi:hypothetical protein
VRGRCLSDELVALADAQAEARLGADAKTASETRRGRA